MRTYRPMRPFSFTLSIKLNQYIIRIELYLDSIYMIETAAAVCRYRWAGRDYRSNPSAV